MVKNNISKSTLSPERIKKARELLKEAGILKIAKKIDTSHTSIYNILLGKSQNIELLNKALREANKIVAKKEKMIENLPL